MPWNLIREALHLSTWKSYDNEMSVTFDPSDKEKPHKVRRIKRTPHSEPLGENETTVMIFKNGKRVK